MNQKIEAGIISNLRYNIDKIWTYFNQPFPFPQKRWQVVLVPSVWVFLVVYILQPLELVIIEEEYKLIVTIIISLITAIVSAVVIYLFPYIFKKFFDAKEWTRYKFFFTGALISILSVAPITLFVYLFYLSYEIKFLYSYLDRASIWLPLGLFIGLVPTFILYFISWKSEINSQLSAVSPSDISSMTEEGLTEEVIAIPKNAREKLVFSPSCFIYAEAQGNYLTIHYIVKEEIVRETLRLTMSQMMRIVEKYDNIKRCHRTFLINISHVENTKKRGQKYVLRFKNCTEEIPVSKTYWDSIANALGF